MLYWVLIRMPRKCLRLRNARRIWGFRQEPGVASSRRVATKRRSCEEYPCVVVGPERKEKLLNFLVRPERGQDFL